MQENYANVQSQTHINIKIHIQSLTAINNHNGIESMSTSI